MNEERLNTALKVLTDPNVKAIAKQIAKQLDGASVFWDAAERSVEFVDDDVTVRIIQNEHSQAQA